jgi:hypothetical protein|tara:strand:+ start:11177 stop:11350 length:174 start_codon:yes stop_codon:yes gene_type:complete
MWKKKKVCKVCNENELGTAPAKIVVADGEIMICVECETLLTVIEERVNREQSIHISE